MTRRLAVLRVRGLGNLQVYCEWLWGRLGVGSGGIGIGVDINYGIEPQGGVSIRGTAATKVKQERGEGTDRLPWLDYALRC